MLKFKNAGLLIKIQKSHVCLIGHEYVHFVYIVNLYVHFVCTLTDVHIIFPDLPSNAGHYSSLSFSGLHNGFNVRYSEIFVYDYFFFKKVENSI